MAHGNMNTFYWKEWRENWQGVVWAPAVVLVLLAMGAVYNVDLSDQQRIRMVDIGTAELFLYAIWILSAILCSASVVAPEIGSGSLQFLSSLPISRHRIWWTKLLVGFVSMQLCIVTSTLTFLLVCAVAIHYRAFTCPMTGVLGDLGKDGWIPILFTLPLFSMGLLMTMLVDRTINALVATVIASALVGTAIMGLARLLQFQINGIDYAVWGLVVLTIPICLSMSYRTFMRGETLKTSNRFKVAIPGLVVDIAIILAALVVAVIWILL